MACQEKEELESILAQLEQENDNLEAKVTEYTETVKNNMEKMKQNTDIVQQLATSMI